MKGLRILDCALAWKKRISVCFPQGRHGNDYMPIQSTDDQNVHWTHESRPSSKWCYPAQRTSSQTNAVHAHSQTSAIHPLQKTKPFDFSLSVDKSRGRTNGKKQTRNITTKWIICLPQCGCSPKFDAVETHKNRTFLYESMKSTPESDQPVGSWRSHTRILSRQSVANLCFLETIRTARASVKLGQLEQSCRWIFVLQGNHWSRPVCQGYYDRQWCLIWAKIIVSFSKAVWSVHQDIIAHSDVSYG